MNRTTRTLRGVLATLLATATATAVLGAAPAEASVSPNMSIGGIGAYAFGYAFCDAASRTITVDTQVTTMEGPSGFAGPTPGPYVNGQYMSYRVFASTDGGPWVPMYSWAPWQKITTIQVFSNGSWIDNPTRLGRVAVSGARGHSYYIAVQVDWWTGRENIANIPQTYNQQGYQLYLVQTSCNF